MGLGIPGLTAIEPFFFLPRHGPPSLSTTTSIIYPNLTSSSELMIEGIGTSFSFEFCVNLTTVIASEFLLYLIRGNFNKFP